MVNIAVYIFMILLRLHIYMIQSVSRIVIGKFHVDLLQDIAHDLNASNYAEHLDKRRVSAL